LDLLTVELELELEKELDEDDEEEEDAEADAEADEAELTTCFLCMSLILPWRRRSLKELLFL